MRRRQFLALGAASLGALLAGCGSTTAGSPTVSTSGSSSGGSGTAKAGEVLTGKGVRLAAASSTDAGGNLSRFAAELFATSAPGAGNAVVSPYSVAAALGMTAYGAKGAAAEALAKVLGGDPAAVAAQLTAVDEAVAAAVAAGKGNKDRGTVDILVEAANRLFPQSGLPVRQEYLDAIAAGYAASVQTVDYKSDPDGVRVLMNKWVADRTHQLIPELLAPGTITTDSRLTLINALYLKAAWAADFHKGDGMEFTSGDGKSVQADNFGIGEVYWLTASGSGWESVTIPYQGGKLAMTVILPETGKFAEVNSKLDGALLQAAVSGGSDLLNVEMPMFKTDFPVNLTQPLQDLGLGPLFQGGDLSGIAGSPGDLLASQVIHQAKISVDENGTEAAAATAVIATAGAAPNQDKPKPRDFVVNRAFLYLIHDTTTGTPLFLGRVSDPTH